MEETREENILHEHLAPSVAFSVDALLHVQWRADSWPQEHLACAAQVQEPFWVDWQQVDGGVVILVK